MASAARTFVFSVIFRGKEQMQRHKRMQRPFLGRQLLSASRNPDPSGRALRSAPFGLICENLRNLRIPLLPS